VPTNGGGSLSVAHASSLNCGIHPRVLFLELCLSLI
jgi:hypothetical protein